MPSPAMLPLIALLVVGCGPGRAETSVTTATALDVITSASPSPPTTTTLSATTTPVPGTTTLVVNEYQIVDGEFRGPESFTVAVSEMFAIEVVADAPGQLHVHGFDLFFELVADEPTLVTFSASAPGIYEVELEGAHAHLFDIEVLG